MHYKNKSFITKKKAFTLIELLIVIAIIGILFIVLVSKVDFATDKAKTTGVQTDFRSFQIAIESVAKENAGLATFGWDTGDNNGNRICDSYDKGDTNKNGVQDDGEVFVGSKIYGETWTNIYTLTNPADANDKSAIAALEAAINKNLDPKLHITIHDDLNITMANGAQDPWNTEYHGYYIANAEVDGKDRGAIVIYSNGANQEFGSEHSISNGIVTVDAPGNNVYGKDDYSIAIIYTYANGYGEVRTSTSGFSNNQTTQGNISNNSGTGGTEGTEDPDVTELLEPGLYNAGAIEFAQAGDVEAAQDMLKTSWNDLLTAGIVNVTDGVVHSNFDENTGENTSSAALDGDLVLPNDGSITSICDRAFIYCTSLTSIVIPDSVTSIGSHAFRACQSLTSIEIPDSVINIGNYAFEYCISLTSMVISDSVISIGEGAFRACTSLISIVIPDNVTFIGYRTFYECPSLTSILIPDSVISIGEDAFSECDNLTSITISDSVTSIGKEAFSGCNNLTSIEIPDSVTSISVGTFYECTSLTSIEIPNSVTSIGNDAFYKCTSLTSIEIPNSVTSIGTGAFRYCNNLTSIVIPDSVTSIGINVFYYCTRLTSVVIPDSVTSIGYYAFSNCTSLTSVTIPDSVTYIDISAFYHCDSLTNIKYCGTKAQWDAISKGYSWNSGVPATYVQCSDGQIKIK